MKYTHKELNELKKKLKAMPAVEKEIETFNKQAAIKFLKNDIISMQARGYTLEQIATKLTTEQLTITAPTLKSYLQRIKAAENNTPTEKVAPKNKPSDDANEAAFEVKIDGVDP